MPSPVGHALAGLATAWIGRRGPASRPRDLWSPLAIACALVAAAPDLDLVFGDHRGWSHSVGASLVVGAAAAMFAAWRKGPAWRAGALVGSAYATHVLLDWLGKDSSVPGGVMALWPLAKTYSRSGVDLFPEISRRYWRPEEFVVGNLRSLAIELAILGPFVAAIAWWRRQVDSPQRTRRARSTHT